MLSYISYSLAKRRIPIEKEKQFRNLHRRPIDLLVLLIILIKETYPAIGQKRGYVLMETMNTTPLAEAMPLVVINVGNLLMENGATEAFLMDISVRFIKSGFLEAVIAKNVKARDLYLSLLPVLEVRLNPQ